MLANLFDEAAQRPGLLYIEYVDLPSRLLPVLLLFGLACAPAIGAGQEEGFVGSAVCRNCHAKTWTTFHRNPHYASLASGREPRERTGCEACHGPGKAHIEAQGGKDNLRSFARLETRETVEACLVCHGRDAELRGARHSRHTLAGVSCGECHSIHGAGTATKLLLRRETETCYACHARVRAQFSLPFKHRVNEGSMRCSDCHNPHGVGAAVARMGVRPRMMEATRAGEEACLKCHTEKRGPFAFEHAAGRIEGCEACHQPHGSVNPRLLKRPAVFTLCLECHTGGGTFGRGADGIALPSATHDLAQARYRQCTACHVRIHGSNADPSFLR